MIVRAGVSRVVAAMTDPNPRVAGGGFERLKQARVDIVIGIREAEAQKLNEAYLKYIKTGLPFVILKAGMTLDGKIAAKDGSSKWITSEAARADVQHWRARSSAILTGSGTVLADNPRLTVRLAPLKGEAGVPPLRVVLDRNLQTLQNAHVLDGSAPTLVFHGAEAKRPAGSEGVECIAVDMHADHLDLSQVLRSLAERGVNELQVEAGPTLCGALFQSELVDELLLYISPILLGDGARPLLALPSIGAVAAGRRLRVIDQRKLGDDLRLLLRE